MRQAGGGGFRSNERIGIRARRMQKGRMREAKLPNTLEPVDQSRSTTRPTSVRLTAVDELFYSKTPPIGLRQDRVSPDLAPRGYLAISLVHRR